MPNIYLRLPTTRCQFFRHRDPHHLLAQGDPVTFSPFMPEYHVLRSYLTNSSAVTQHVTPQCFSHQQWQNMLYGRAPGGGPVHVKRSHIKPLSYAEVMRLNGQNDYAKTEKEDYLCIKLPTEVVVVDSVRHVTPSWNLNIDGIRQLVVLLNAEFKRAVVEWCIATFDFCTSGGVIVARSQVAMLERFLMRYGIDPTEAELDSLRRVIARWIRTEHAYFSAYSCADMQFIDDKEHRIPVNEVLWT